LTNILIVATYALASAALAWALPMFTGLSQMMGALVGTAVFLAAGQVHAVLRTTSFRLKLEREIRGLKKTAATLKAELDQSHKQIAEVSTALAKRSDAQERKVVGELQILEGLIREFAINIARKAKPQPLDAVDAAEQQAAQAAKADNEAFGDPALLEIIRRSLEDNRVDLYLQPTVSLPQRKVRFYEALSRLRSEDGAVIMPAQYIRVAAPAGLMSVVDNLLLFRCVQVVRSIANRRRDIGVFCNISGHTLNDTEFFPQFLDFMHHNRDLAGQIVFEFTQDSVLRAGAQEEANLRYLASLGFALSMDQVSTLELNFAKLKSIGFQYLKVRADTLLSGMQDARATVAAEDLKALLARHGLNLIVERIEDEKTVVQLLEYNVDFGQGYLFGEPRPIRDIADAPREHEMQAAPPANVTFLPKELVRRLAS
jgi:cyclic-di-GMP phosphodiesterase TipF (flagellum assembly factor)